ncbi:MAG: NADPH:quinone oxidoreductase family protein [Burkholderiales bacterium]|nr:NADPH:quinone oxidoreductase family protein [Burkholderiales bacterium]
MSGVAVRTLPLPVPGPHQVLVRVRAAALNFPDLLMTQGRYQFKPEMPFVPGLEAAGEVVSVGDGVTHVRPGDAVVAHARCGAIAECMLAAADEVRPMPAGLDFAAAAAFHAAAITAYVALVRRADLQPGETLLVHGASGGVGMATVQLGRHLGARVIATGRSEDKLATVRAHGAHETINLADDLRERVMELTGGRGVDVVMDAVGGDVFDASLRCLGWGGRLLVVGFVGGRIPEVKANYILIKNLSIIGVRAGEYGRRDPARGAENVRAIDRLASAGVFRPHIGVRLPLDRAAEGLAMLARGSVTGKVVIEP